MYGKRDFPKSEIVFNSTTEPRTREDCDVPQEAYIGPYAVHELDSTQHIPSGSCHDTQQHDRGRFPFFTFQFFIMKGVWAGGISCFCLIYKICRLTPSTKSFGHHQHPTNRPLQHDRIASFPPLDHRLLQTISKITPLSKPLCMPPPTVEVNKIKQKEGVAGTCDGRRGVEDSSEPDNQPLL